MPLIASDAPVVLHNRFYEGQHISVTGYANVGLQLFLPLGPRLALLGYDAAAYDLQRDCDGIVRVQSADQIRLINDLQWEAAQAVLLVTRDMPEGELQARATHWTSRRPQERVIFLEEVVDRSTTEVWTRQGGGQAPSAVSLDLPFFKLRLPAPPRLGQFEVPPFRDAERVRRTDRAFATMRTKDAKEDG